MAICWFEVVTYSYMFGSTAFLTVNLVVALLSLDGCSGDKIALDFILVAVVLVFGGRGPQRSGLRSLVPPAVQSAKLDIRFQN